MKSLLHRVVLGAAVIGLAGCNSLTSNAVSSLWRAHVGVDGFVTAERLQAIHAPAMYVELGQTQALLVSPGPISATGASEWRGVSEMLAAHSGRITQTAGLNPDVVVTPVADDPLALGLHRIPSGTKVTRVVDYPGQYRTSLHQHARYRVGSITTVKILGTRYRLRRVDERIHIPELGFKATNHYWVEPETGLVRQSVQYLGPEMPPIKLTLVKTGEDSQP